MKPIICLFSLLISNYLFCQNNYQTENEKFIYWQPNVEIGFKDFKGEPDSVNLKLCKEYDYHTITSVALHSVMDIPAKRRDRGRLLEKVYFAPAFCKKCSFSISPIQKELVQDRIYFDIAELCARKARILLDSLVSTTKAYGTLSVMYGTVKTDTEQMMLELFGAYGKDILRDKKEGAYEYWRKWIDEELKKTEKYITSPAECYRLLSGKPILQGYIMPENIIGDLRNIKK
jgi:hypothetical protein